MASTTFVFVTTDLSRSARLVEFWRLLFSQQTGKRLARHSVAMKTMPMERTTTKVPLSLSYASVGLPLSRSITFAHSRFFLGRKGLPGNFKRRGDV